MEKEIKAKILVVDDERAASRAFMLKLQSLGFEVKIAHDGEEALDILKKEKFDAIILDLVMPKVDGFGVLAELKSRDDKTPVIVTSNLSQDEDIRRAKSLGAVDYFVKSDTPINEIIEYVKRAIHL